MQMKFYRCRHCGKIIAMIKDSGVPTICCGENMMELESGMSDGVTEKHVPVIKIDGNKFTVTVGEKNHPMEPNHYIEWIVLQTDRGIQQKWLYPQEHPSVQFAIMDGEKVWAAYEYCSIHKLWKSEFNTGCGCCDSSSEKNEGKHEEECHGHEHKQVSGCDWEC